MGWMCVQTPFPPKEQPDKGSEETGAEAEEEQEEQI